MKYLSIFLIFISLAHADDPVVLHKGDAAPYEGVLLDQPHAQTASDTKYNLGVCTQVSALKDTENSLLTQRINNANTAVNNLSDQLAKTQDNSFLKQLGMFVLGAGVATLVAFGAAKAVR